MDPRTELAGIVTVLNTPFDNEGKVDPAALSRHVEYALDAGVDGFLIPAMAAEVAKLSHSERRNLLETVLGTVAGARPVVAGVYADGGDSRLELVRDYVSLGARVVLVSIPFESADQLVRDVSDVAAAGPEIVMVQDWAPSGYGIPIEAIERLAAEVPAFRSIKIEVAASGIKYSQVLERTGGSLHVAGGWAVTQMMEGLERGVHAFMPTALHEIYVAIYRRYQAGDITGARELYHKLLPIITFSNQHLDVSIHFFKRLLHRQGIYATSLVREPTLPFDRHHEAQAEYLIGYAIDLMATLRGK